MTALTGYGWVTLVVSNLEASVGWYRRVFGLEVLMTDADTCAVGEADRFVYLVEPRSLFVVGLRQSASGATSGAGCRGALAGLALSVGPQQLSDWLGRLDHCDVAYRGPTPWTTGSVAHLEDPDGVPLLLFEPALTDL